MKKLFTLVFCLLFTFLLHAQTATAPTSGSGTSSDPYQIATLDNLYWLSQNSSYWDKCFIQTDNINASGISNFSPIGNSTTAFTGTYNGNSYTISNLTVDRASSDYIGLVGYAQNAMLKNIGLIGVNMNGSFCVGAIAGKFAGSSSSVTNCYATGSVTGNNSVGGFIGSASSTISKCHSSCSVSGSSAVGGFVGINAGEEFESSTILNCYCTGDVNCWDYICGGFVGLNSPEGDEAASVTDCYCAGSVSGQASAAAFVGENRFSSGIRCEIQHCYWNATNNGGYEGYGINTGTFSAAGLTTSAMKMASTFINFGWDFTKTGNVWAINGTDNSGYPYLRYQAYPSSDIWLGTSTTEWSTAANWSEESVPASATSVIVPNVTNDPVMSPTATADCNNLTVETAGNLTIQSSAAGTGSLIIHGTSLGTVTAELYMTKDAWHIISPIASGQPVADFLTANTNIPEKSGNRGMMDYNTIENKWNPYYTTGSGNMDAVKGFSMRISTSDGTVTFTGALTSGNTIVSLSNAGDGWNCVGNPYPSAIKMNDVADGSNNFLRANAITASNLDGSYACVYVWDDANLSYKILNNAGDGDRRLGQNIIQSGQGFFVKAASGVSSISFTSAMQVHSTGTALKSAETTWPGFELTASASGVKASTVVAFNAQMTKGLDPTYDAGLLRGTSGVSLYTHLVDDNGVDFAIQCLPESYNSLVIPLGVESKSGGEITFSAETVELPTACSVILEDKLTKTFTSLADGATYKATVSAGTTAVGRFYIHTSDNTTTDIPGLSVGIDNLKAYIANQSIIIEGMVSNQAIATLHDLRGQQLLVHVLQKGSLNTFSCSNLMKGMYLLTIQQNGATVTKKLVKY